MMEKAIIRHVGGTAGENGDLDARNRESFNKQEGSMETNAKARIRRQPLSGREQRSKEQSIHLILILEIREQKQRLYPKVGRKENVL